MAPSRHGNLSVGRQRLWAIATALTLLVTTVVVAWQGARDAARQERVWAGLDGVVELVQLSGAALSGGLMLHRVQVGWAVTAAAFGFALVALLFDRRRAAPVLLLGAAVTLATWGQVSLLGDQVAAGVVFYGAGIAVAAWLGVRFPLPRRGRWDGAVAGEDASASSRPPLPLPWECLLVVTLTVLALMTRVYALTELPSEFEGEMIIAMFASRTLAGLNSYMEFGLTGNSNGVAHLLPQLVSFQTLGTSVFALRWVAAFAGTFTVPLFYLLVRRLAGVGAAVAGTLLLVSAPEQLFWSRNENTCFILISLLAVVTVSLSVRAIERPAFRTIAAAALWMPFTRYFYAPGIVMMLYAPLLYVHGLVFRSRVRTTVWYGIPIFAAGFGLWLVSLSAVQFATRGEWRFINPAHTTNAPVWQGEGRYQGASLPELVRLQLRQVSTNLAQVAANMTYRTWFSSWYRRVDDSAHPTTVPVGVSVMLALGLGYLLTQLYEPRAFALWVWIGLGLLPAIMSLDPAPRRMGLAYPAFYAVIGVLAAAATDAVRSAAGRWAGRAAALLIGASVVATGLAGMSSYLQLPKGWTMIDQAARGTKPVFGRSDAIFHNLGPNWELTLAFAHADELFNGAARRCVGSVEPNEWLSQALRPQCDFSGLPYRFSLAEEEAQQVRGAYDPRRIAFVITDERRNRRQLELLRALFPAVEPTPLDVGSQGFAILAFELERSAIEALRSPSLRLPSNVTGGKQLATGLLAGVFLEPASPATGRGLVVEGSFLIDADGWYAVDVGLGCGAASFRLGDLRMSPDVPVPFTRGVHAFTITLPAAFACPLPLQVELRRWVGRELVKTEPPLLLAPDLAQRPGAAAAAVIRYPGHEEVPLPFDLGGAVVHAAAERDGTLTVLQRDDQGLRLHRFSASGQEEKTWAPRVTDHRPPLGLSVAPDGTTFLIWSGAVVLYDREGEETGVWTDPPVRTSAIGHLPDGSILSALADRHAVVVLDRNGETVQEWKHFEGGPGAFFEPTSVAVSPEGDVAVIETDGEVLLFRTPREKFAPEFVRQFRIELPIESVHLEGWSFDRQRRLIIPELTTPTTLVYNLDGKRMMATEPERDLGRQAFGAIRRVHPADGRLYVVDQSQQVRMLTP